MLRPGASGIGGLALHRSDVAGGAGCNRSGGRSWLRWARTGSIIEHMFDEGGNHRADEGPRDICPYDVPVEDRTPGSAYGACDDEGLVEALVQVGCLESATRLELVRIAAVADRRQLWAADGQSGLEAWLELRLGLGRRSAAEIAAVARVIESLPCVARAFGEGRLSWDQVVPVCALATPQTDSEWAEEAVGFGPGALWAMLRARKTCDRTACDVFERRGLRLRRRTGGGTGISALLPDEQAERLRVALDRIREADAGPDPDTGTYPSLAQQRADALGCLAGMRLGADPDCDRATVVVHADVELMTGQDPAGRAELEDGTAVAPEVVRRMACDSRIEWAMHGPDGTILGVGRARRSWPGWLSRQIRARDGQCCRHPGCGRPIHHIHHMRQWCRGGRTDSANGVGLCFFHHHLVHEGGWVIRGDADGEVVFTSPTGRSLSSHPRLLDPRVRRRILDTG